MAGENIQLAQNTATDAATPPADPALDVMPGDAVDPGAADLSGTTDDLLLDAAPDTTEAAAEALPANEAENPYGLAALWAQGDFIARGTLIILVGMSLYSWFLILTKLWDQARMLKQARQANRDFWTGTSLTDGLQKLTGSDNAYRTLVESGINASSHHEGKLTDKVPLADWISGNLQRNVDRLNNELQGGLSFLASVGSTAPFVGLFGTVWGIYHALIAIGVAGQASIDKVAGPVGEALIMTAIGLAVAVPAVLGYNLLLRRNKAILDQYRYFTNDLYATLVSSKQK
ncbi:MAG: MotA/TolQ/ExbB proton channel family protein [Gammaproteobacteria bacterium]|jgi:biopolymer transport protein ExbB|nr:MotA/TolQ/ExbB proton channel family protein [Gammaproteobacteria bacterium]